MGNVCGTVIGPLRDWVFLFLGHLFFFFNFLFVLCGFKHQFDLRHPEAAPAAH